MIWSAWTRTRILSWRSYPLNMTRVSRDSRLTSGQLNPTRMLAVWTSKSKKWSRPSSSQWFVQCIEFAWYELVSDAQRKIHQLGHQTTKGVSHVWPAWHRKNVVGTCLRRPDKRYLTAYSSVTNDDLATFLKLAGPALVQMFIGDGARLVRDAFALGK